MTRFVPAENVRGYHEEQAQKILAPGEASCLAYAKIHDAVAVTDDRTDRECCGRHGVTFTGTIGIHKACCLDGTLSPEEADITLQAMIEAGFYSPVQCISGLI